MKNIKKIALSLLVVGLAVGFSAFVNAERIDSTFAPYYYGHTGNGVYQLIGETYDEANCTVGTTEPCIYSSASELLGGFTLGQPSEPNDLTKIGSDNSTYDF